MANLDENLIPIVVDTMNLGTGSSMNPPRPPIPEPQRKFDGRGFALAIFAIGLATLIGWLIFHGPRAPDPSRRSRISESNVLMLYLLAVVCVATRSSRSAAIFTSILAVAAFDFCFVRPY